MKWSRVVVVGSVFVVVGLLGATVALGAGELTDDFTGSDGDPWNRCIWTDDDLANGQSTIQGNEGELQVTGNDSNTGLARQLADRASHDDFEAVFKQRFTGGTDEDKRFGFEFRRSSAWRTQDPKDAPDTGYQLHHQQATNRVVLYRFDDGDETELDVNGGIDREATNWFRVRAVGDFIQVRWWVDGMEEPDSWNIEETDDTYLTGEAFSFTHWRSDGDGTRQAIIDDLDIQITNDPPVAEDDSYETEEDTALVVNPEEGVLDNDSDADGDSLCAGLVTGPTNGTLDLNKDGGFTYTPDA
ncbi:MAG: Ig-like domain-containing protein, partial [Actinomycetota bacterium]